MNRKNAGQVKKANSFVFLILRIIFRPFLFIYYHFKFEMKTSKNIKRPCFILSNHQTVFDQFAISMGFKFGINFIASETLFRHGIGSWFMKILVRPIPFSKGNSDITAIRNMMSVIQNGGSVAMFPSGNRSFYGTESTIVPGIGKLAKKFNVPLVLVQIKGGFHTLPRWKEKPCRGKMRASVSRVLSPEELAAMSAADIDDIIIKELSFNDFEYNRNAQIVFRGKHKAEYLESFLFYCPECHSMSALHSEGNEFSCRDCGMKLRINNTGFLEKIDKADKIPDDILKWSEMQLDYIKSFDFSDFMDKPVFSDDDVIFSEAVRAKKEVYLGTGKIELFKDKLVVCGKEFLFTDTVTAVHGARKMTIYSKDGVYAVLSPFRINLVKYMICSYHLKNKTLGVTEEYYGY